MRIRSLGRQDGKSAPGRASGELAWLQEVLGPDEAGEEGRADCPTPWVHVKKSGHYFKDHWKLSKQDLFGRVRHSLQELSGWQQRQ